MSTELINLTTKCDSRPKYEGSEFPIIVTDIALEKLIEANREDPEFIRVGVLGGGCIPEGEKILLASGEYENAERIKVNQELCNIHGFTSLVKEVYRREYEGNLINIIPSVGKNSHSICLTEEHPVFCIKRKNRYKGGKRKQLGINDIEQCSAESLEKGDLLIAQTVRNIQDVSKLTEDMCTLLGIYLAEGCITPKFNKDKSKVKAFRTEFYLGHHEKEYFKLLISSLNNLGIKFRVREKRTAVRVDVDNTKFSKLLLAYCGNNNKCLGTEKLLSPDLVSLPYNKLKLFAEAYIMGDGTVKKNKSMVCSTVNEGIVHTLNQIFIKLYGLSSCNKYIRKNNSYNIEGRTGKAKDFYEVSCFPHSRSNNFIYHNDVPIVSAVGISQIISKPYKGMVFNYKCDPCETFVVKNTVVHNCSGYMFDLDFVKSSKEGDLKKEFVRGDESVTLLIDPKSAYVLQDITLDYISNKLGNSGFKFVGGALVKRTCGCGESFSV